MNCARPYRSEGLGGNGGLGYIGNMDINMQAVLPLLVLGYPLEGQTGPSGRINKGPVITSVHRFATEDRGPERGKRCWVLAIHYDFIHASDHCPRLQACQNPAAGDGR